MFDLVSDWWLYKSSLKAVGNYSEEEKQFEWAVLLISAQHLWKHCGNYTCG